MVEQRTPDWLVERIALKELPPDELARATEQLLSETDGQQRLDALARSNEEILQAYPPATLSAAIAERTGSRTSKRLPMTGSWRSLLWAAPLLAASAAIVLVASPGLWPTASTETILTKGLGPEVRVHRQTKGGTDRLRDGDHARAGDVLQLVMHAGEQRHGVLISLDGAGSANLLYPSSATAGTQLSSAQVRLPYAYELDAAPGFERFFLITSNNPIDVPSVMAAARQLVQRGPEAKSMSLPLTEPLQQTSFLLGKE